MAVLDCTEYRINEVGMTWARTGIAPVVQALRGIFSDPLRKDVRVWVLESIVPSMTFFAERSSINLYWNIS